MLSFALQTLEPALIAAMLLGFWFATPTRDSWLWLLAGIPVVGVLRWRLEGYAWPRSPLNRWLLGLALLGVLNILAAPFNRAPANPLYAYTVIFARLWLGIALIWWLIALARRQGTLQGPLLVASVVAGGLLLLALGSTAWTGKSSLLSPIIGLLPRWGEALRPLEMVNMNPNEVAGALSLLTPLAFGLAAWAGVQGKPVAGLGMALIAGGLLLVTILGQSRFALTGILTALLLLLPWLFGQGWLRATLWISALALVAVQAYLILRPVPSAPPTTELLNQRDSESLTVRFDLWVSALQITRDYPLTGVGANMYRDGRVRALYPVLSFPNNAPPHAHNAWLQISADLGLPGLVIYLGIQSTLLLLLIRIWQQGDQAARAVALGVGGGLLAHTLYSLGDAVPIWDRLAYMYWLLAGLAAAQYSLITKPASSVRKP